MNNLNIMLCKNSIFKGTHMRTLPNGLSDNPLTDLNYDRRRHVDT